MADLAGEAVLQLTGEGTAQITVNLASEASLLLDGEATAQVTVGLRAVGGMTLSARAETTVPRHDVAGEAVLKLSPAATLETEAELAGEAVILLWPGENPLGEGYGLTVGDGSAGSFNLTTFDDITAQLREGDEFIAVLPDHGVNGMVGVARVLERTASDEDRRQRLSAIQFTPFADAESLVPRLGSGDQVRVPQQRTVQHDLNRFQRSLWRERKRR